MFKKTTLPALLALLGAAALLSSCDFNMLTHEQSFSKEYKSADYSKLVLQNGNGDITISSAETSVITINAVKRAASEEALDAIDIAKVDSLETETKGEADDTLNITTLNNNSDSGDTAVHFTITVPQGMAVELNGGNGEIAISGDILLQRARLNNGNIGITDLDILSGDVSVENGNLEAELREVDSDLTLSVDSGTLTVKAARDLNAYFMVQTSGSVVSDQSAKTAQGPYDVTLSVNSGTLITENL